MIRGCIAKIIMAVLLLMLVGTGAQAGTSYAEATVTHNDGSGCVSIRVLDMNWCATSSVPGLSTGDTVMVLVGTTATGGTYLRINYINIIQEL